LTDRVAATKFTLRPVMPVSGGRSRERAASRFIIEECLSKDCTATVTCAGSFGSVAERYDRFRPGYPDALIDDLIGLRPLDVLDVGCGTGKVAVALAERGVRVLGVEPDAQMASVARGHGIPVEVACFEDWDDAGRRFDLITSGHAWHGGRTARRRREGRAAA
jgi:2-polyprenyl-3-methyl-5-hydroxy-6-metoxy-1,4-benzoquinol methylase